MRLISLDLELNQKDNNPKIIEIGAVCFDPKNAKVFENFHMYVNPGEPITEEITKLTGIDDAKVNEAPPINVAALALTAWKAKMEINKIGIVWGAGHSNDIRKIFQESNIDNPFSARIIDVKAVYQMLSNVGSASLRQKVGLSTALTNLGLHWNFTYGPPHRALADAYNTYRCYIFLSECMRGGFETARSVRLVSN